MRIRLTRLLPVIGVVTAASLVMATPASACTYQYDDGGAETTLDLDYTDDVAIKRLDGPKVQTVVLPGGTAPKAELDVYASAYGCGSGTTNRLLVNGTPVASFNACSVWPSYWGSSWASFSFSRELINSGVNSFQIIDVDNSYTSGIFFGVDQNNFHGRSTMSANGISVGGELMWRLDLSGLVC